MGLGVEWGEGPLCEVPALWALPASWGFLYAITQDIYTTTVVDNTLHCERQFTLLIRNLSEGEILSSRGIFPSGHWWRIVSF